MAILGLALLAAGIAFGWVWLVVVGGLLAAFFGSLIWMAFWRAFGRTGEGR